MNRRKNEVHAALVDEHRRLLSDHSQLRTVALGQSQKIRRLRGTFSFSLLFFGLLPCLFSGSLFH